MSFQGYSQDDAEPSSKQEVTAAETWLNGELQWPGQRRWQTSTTEEEDAKEAAEVECICLTLLTRAKCGTHSTLCWKDGNISGSTELFAL